MPRRKITPSQPDGPATELPDLTPQQQHFWTLVETEGMSATQAWQTAYDATNMSKGAIAVEASRLYNHPKIALWRAAARKAVLGRAGMTKMQYLQRLQQREQEAAESGNHGAALQALKYQGEVLGFYVERFEDVTQREADPVDTLRAIAQKHPEIAASLAAEKNIAWDKINDRATKH